jgi:glycosyltransferase involved in cell wall biosynthesis
VTVTALCLTHNRRNWLPLAIECFQRQTYPAKLLILADGDDVTDIVPAAENIRLYVMQVPPATTGGKCNFGCSIADADVIVTWDDDDWSGPDRIAHQLSQMETTGKAVVGYHSMWFTDGVDWWKYTGIPTTATGTSLCYRRDWWAAHPFRPLNVGYDVWFVKAAVAAGELVSMDAGDLMYASIHAGNSSPRELGTSCWHKLAAERSAGK